MKANFKRKAAALVAVVALAVSGSAMVGGDADSVGNSLRKAGIAKLGNSL